MLEAASEALGTHAIDRHVFFAFSPISTRRRMAGEHRALCV